MLRVLAISIGRMPSAFSDDDCLARDHVSDKVAPPPPYASCAPSRTSSHACQRF
jgi:hypothetical protein